MLNKKLLLILVLIVGIAPAFSTFAATGFPCDEHVISYLRLDEDTGTDLVSSCSELGQNDGDSGTAAWGTGVRNSGLEFAAADTGAVLDNASMGEGNLENTLEAWFNADDVSSWRAIVGRNSVIVMTLLDGKVSCQFRNAANKYTYTATGDAATNGNWFYAACSMNGTHLNGYIKAEADDWADTIQVTSNAFVGPLVIAGGEGYCIGGLGGTCEIYDFDGVIDEIRISSIGRDPRTYFIVPPAVTDITATNIRPHDDEYNNTNPTLYSYNYDADLQDGEYVTDIRLITNSTVEQTNTTAIANNTAASFSVAYPYADQTIDWYVSVLTNSSEDFNSTETTYYFNATPSIVDVLNIYPTDDEVNNTNPVGFKYKYAFAPQNNEYITAINFINNGSVEQTNTTAIANNTVDTFTKTFTTSNEEQVDWWVSITTNATTIFNSTPLTYYYDDVVPVIVHSYPTNNTAIIVNGNVTINGTITDPNLHNVNFSVYNATDDLIWNYTSWAVSSPFIYSWSVNLGIEDGAGTQTFKLILEAADDHNKLVKEAKYKPTKPTVTKDLNGKKFRTQNNLWDVEIELISSQLIEAIDTNFKDDVFSYKIKTNQEGTGIKVYNFKVKADNLEYIESQHLGHLVSSSRYYIDFDGIDGTANVDCKKHYCDVEITTTQNTLDIKSIGGVNVIEEVVEFEANNDNGYGYTQNPSFTSTSGEAFTYTLNISINQLRVTLSNNGTFWFNGTEYPATFTNSSTEYFYSVAATNPIVVLNEKLAYNWTFNLDYVNGSTDFITTTTQYNDIYKPQLVNCDATNTTVIIELLLFDELNLTNITGSLASTFTYANEAETYSGALTISEPDTDSVTICIYPPTASLIIDSFEEWDADGLTKKFYFIDHHTLDNTTHTYNRYLLNDTKASLVGFLVQNVLNEPEANTIIDFLRWYPDLNEYKSIGMIKTGDLGEGAIYLEINTVWYSLLAYQDNSLVQNFNPQIIKCLGATCDSKIVITNTTTSGEWYIYNDDVSHSCNYDNSTLTLTCNYVDTSDVLDYWRLQVFENTAYGPLEVCVDTNTATSGTVTCTLSNIEGKTYGWSLDVHHQDLVNQNGGTIYAGLAQRMFKSDGWLPALFLIITLGLIGLKINPPTGMILLIVGVILANVIQLIALPWAGIAALAIISLIIIYYMELF